MKELSIEEKAKAYDEAKLRMSAAYNSNRCTIGFMNEIFPELKESEDERIRKRIIHALHGDVLDIEETTKAIAWLEKQGKIVDYYEDRLDEYACKYFNKGYKQALEKQAEPVLEWSEEDEKGLGDALWAIEQARTIAKDENDMGNLWYAETWLKSLKDKLYKVKL